MYTTNRMQSYKRAYRDPQSSLSPLTHMSCSTVFNFNFGSDNSPNEPIANVTLTHMPTKSHDHMQSFPTRKGYSKNFWKIRSVFSPGNAKPFKNCDDFKMKNIDEVKKSATAVVNSETDNKIPPKCMFEEVIDGLASIDLSLSKDAPSTRIQTEELESTRKLSRVPQDQLSQEELIAPLQEKSIRKDEEIITPLQEKSIPKELFSRPKKRFLKKDEKINASSESSSQISPFTPIAVPKIVSNVNIENNLTSTFNSHTTKNDFDHPKTFALNAESNGCLMSNGQENISTAYKWNWFDCSDNPVKTLSPRVQTVLRRTGLCRYSKLFQEEEIDMEVLKVLTKIDLKRLGILSSSERTQISRECMKLKNKKNL